MSYAQKMTISRERRTALLRALPADGWVSVTDLAARLPGTLWHSDRTRRMGDIRATLSHLLLVGRAERERDPWAPGYRWRRKAGQ